jgi:hypothetical protein
MIYISKKSNPLVVLGKVKLYMERNGNTELEVEDFVKQALGRTTPRIIEIARTYIDDLTCD